MNSILTEKKYYLITNPEIPGYRVENYGDRQFTLYGQYVRGWQVVHGIAIGGDVNWPITEENILKCGNHILQEEIARIKEESKKKKYKSWQCQSCGEAVGWLGRIFKFHRCSVES